MAGSQVTFLRPGYSTLWTKDLPYTEGTGEDDLDPLDPGSSRPLIEGEWLEIASDGKRYTRGGNNDSADADEGTKLAFIYFMERGRYDSQVGQKCHCVWGPSGYELRTKGCDSTGLSVGSLVSVQDVEDDDGIVRRWLALAVAGLVIGQVTRIYGTNDISVVVAPSLAAL